MRKVFYIAPIAALVFGGFASEATAQTATATYEVTAINEVSVTGNPSLLINAASELSGVTDNSTTWSVTTNESNKKVTGAIDTAMPSGVTLQVHLTAPAGATSAGATALSTTAANLVTGISTLEASGLGVVYTLKATPQAGVVASASKTVTYTITAAI